MLRRGDVNLYTLLEKDKKKKHSVLESLKVSPIFFTSKIGSRLAGYLGFGGDVDYVSR